MGTKCRLGADGDPDITAAASQIVREKLEAGLPLTLRVMSGSMSPLVAPGERVIVDAVGKEGLHRGDIVVVPRRKGFLVHRVTRVLPGGWGRQATLVTRGDRAECEDGAVALSEVLGRVSAVCKATRAIDLTTRWGRALDRVLTTRARLA